MPAADITARPTAQAWEGLHFEAGRIQGSFFAGLTPSAGSYGARICSVLGKPRVMTNSTPTRSTPSTMTAPLVASVRTPINCSQCANGPKRAIKPSGNVTPLAPTRSPQIDAAALTVGARNITIAATT